MCGLAEVWPGPWSQVGNGVELGIYHVFAVEDDWLKAKKWGEYINNEWQGETSENV